MVTDDAIQAAVDRITRAALALFVADPHLWSSRPCATCRAIGELLYGPFGCYQFAQLPPEKQNRAHGGN